MDENRPNEPYSVTVPVDEAELQRLREKKTTTDDARDKSEKASCEVTGRRDVSDEEKRSIFWTEAVNVYEKRCGTDSHTCAGDDGRHVFVRSGLSGDTQRSPRQYGSPGGHAWSTIGLSKKEIGLAFGLPDDKKIAEQVAVFLRTSGIILKPEGRKKNFVAVDTIPAHLFPQFKKYMLDYYKLHVTAAG